MKKIFSSILVLLTVFMISSCKNKAQNTAVESESTDSESAVSFFETAVSEASSMSESPSDDSAVTSSVNTDAVSQKQESEKSDTEDGQSNKKYTFGFGVAKNGQAHEISRNNQKRFDLMQNVEALALDTVSTDKRMYLTFDCGYEHKDLTASILDTLKEKNVKAAFFVTLSYAKSNPQYVKRMIDEGHTVGNHSATHPVFPNISRSKMSEEVLKVDEYILDNFGYKMKYFRFPTGAYSESALELVTSVGYKSVFWSLAYSDYDTDKQQGAQKAYKTVTDRFHPGAVMLLHAVSEDNAAVLWDVIDKAVLDGYEFKTLDDYFD